MTLIAGIDEAGYGPLLGPLVVSATAFRVADPPTPDCLWRRLAPVVTKKPDRHNDSVVVGDSKRLYSRAIGLKHLETAALAFLAAMEKPVETRGAALAALSLKDLPDAAACPWHKGPELALPVELDPRTLGYKAARLKGHLAERGVQFDFRPRQGNPRD